MYDNFVWKIIAIILIVLGCAASLTFKDIRRGMDLKGGTELIYQIDVSRLEESQRRDIQEQAKEVLERRLNILGVQDIKIRPSGRYDISIQIPATKEKGKTRNIIERSGKLMFKLLHKTYNDVKGQVAASPNFWPAMDPKDRTWVKQKIQEILTKKKNREYREEENPLDVAAYIYKMQLPKDEKQQKKVIAQYKEQHKEDFLGVAVGKVGDLKGKKIAQVREYLLLNNAPEKTVSGNLLSDAYPTTDNLGRRAVGFEFRPAGATKFGRITEDHKGRNLCIVLDGKIKSMPTIQSRIDSKGIITGEFSKDEIHELVVILKAGALPARLKVPPTELTTGPGLGKNSIQAGFLACIIGFVFVFIFILIYYRLSGLIANIALLLNLFIILAVLAFYNAFLTLPGIAGIILTVGMSVDANILIFERIREELTRGKTLRHAVNLGYDKAFWAIFDANLTTLITSIILFVIGTGPIKGFAVTLSVGILSSMLTALFVTRVIFGFIIAKKWITKLNMMRLLDNPQVPFLNYRHVGVTISMFLILAGISYMFTQVGGSILGIDFTGGTRVRIKFKDPQNILKVKEQLGMVKEFRDAEVVAIEEGRVAGKKGSREYQIRVRTFSKLKEPILHGDDPKKMKIAFLYFLKSKTGRPFGLEIKKDLNGTKPDYAGLLQGFKKFLSGDENKNNLIVDDVDLITEVDEDAKKWWNVTEVNNNLHWTMGILTNRIDTTNPEFNLSALQTKIEEYLEVKYEIVKEETQGQLTALFKEELVPTGFLQIEEGKRFIPSKEDETIGQIRMIVNLEKASEAPLEEEVIERGLLSAEFLERLREERGTLKGFEKEFVNVKLLEGGDYIRKFEIVAGPVPKGSSSLYRSALRGYLQDSDSFFVSEPFPKISKIGPAVAKNLKAKAFWAIIFSLFAIIAYITIRFELVFGFGAVAALVHDLILALCLIGFVDHVGLLEIKINLPLIAAFLTILGYSLNDTIVVFDRIRENLIQRRRKEGYMEIINNSLNETLSRTVLTSISTLIVVLVLFFAGVKEIQGFSFALIIGVVVGTYSSLFIATPVVVFFHRRAKRLEEKRRQGS